LFATYSEMLMGKPVRLNGEPVIARRSIHMTLTEPGGEIPLAFTLFLPRPPASVLTGIIAGVAFLGPEPEPTASRIAMVRVPTRASLDDTNRYLLPEPGVISADLGALGLNPDAPDRVDGMVQEFLIKNRDTDNVDTRVQLGLAAELDPCHLEAREPPAEARRAPERPPAPLPATPAVGSDTRERPGRSPDHKRMLDAHLSTRRPHAGHPRLLLRRP
jgi:hypothetical protein